MIGTGVARDRALGLLLGAALGDGLGAPFEGRLAVEPEELAALEAARGVLAHTDDTALMLPLAEHVARRGGVDRAELAQEFARAWRAEPWRGYGGAVPHVFGLLEAGTPWERASRSTFGGQGSFANGGAMRVAPVALVATDLAHAAELGRHSAEVTHAHDDAQRGSALQAAAAYLALRGGLGPAGVLRELASVVEAPAWRDKLAVVAELLDRRPPPERAAQALGNDVSALGSVPVALLAHLLHLDDPMGAIRYAIRVAGDADTIAAMAGALAGARSGAAALPPELVDRIEARKRLRGLAAALSPSGQEDHGRP